MQKQYLGLAVGLAITLGGSEVVKADWEGVGTADIATAIAGQVQASILKEQPVGNANTSSPTPVSDSSTTSATRILVWNDNNGANPTPTYPGNYGHTISLEANTPLTANITMADGPINAAASVEVKSSTQPAAQTSSRKFTFSKSYNYYTGTVGSSGGQAPTETTLDFSFSQGDTTTVPRQGGGNTVYFSAVLGLELINEASTSSSYKYIANGIIYHYGNADASSGQNIAQTLSIEPN